MTGLYSFGDHVLGGFALSVVLWVGVEYASLSLSQKLLEHLVAVHFGVYVVVVLYLYQRDRIGLSGRSPGGSGSTKSFDDEVFNEVLQESETLRRNVVGVHLDDETREAAFEESPTFAGEYLESEARKP